MQRISVLLPVPDAPMTALIPVSPNARSMSCKTGLPGTYSLVSPRMTRELGMDARGIAAPRIFGQRAV